MGLVELLLLAIGLSMDAFAVSVGKGLSMRRLHWGQAAIIALFFGGFQALMPALGWFLGAGFGQIVDTVGGWIAFVLLAFIGTKMLWDGIHSPAEKADANNADNADEDNEDDSFALDFKELFMLAIATSIDAFAAGVALALLNVDIIFSVLFIGLTTFALSLVGVALGHQFGSRWERPSAIVGGLVLIVIGVKTLLQSFGVL